MKSCLNTIASVTAVAVLFSSCSRVIQRHESFMNNLKTKSDVTYHFGYPAQYQELGDTSRWFYDMQEQKIISQRNPNPIKTPHGFEQAEKVDKFYYADKYLEITFIKDSVLNSTVAGVNYTLRKPQTLNTVLLVVGILGVAALLLYDPFSDFAYLGTF